MRRRQFRISFVFVLMVVSLAQSYHPSNAQGTPTPGKTWVVTAPSDQFTKLDGMCDSTCYLAEALGQAHDGDTITFLPELKGNFFLGPGDLTLNDLSIIGKGSSSADIFLQYRPQVVAKRVLLQNVTIESAAVFGTSSLELRDVTMRSRGGYLFVGEGSNLLATNLTYIDEIEVYSEPWAAFRIEGSADIYNSLFVSKTSGGAGLVLNRGISIIRNSTIVLADNTIKTSD